jgi:hypothetical protein
MGVLSTLGSSGSSSKQPSSKLRRAWREEDLSESEHEHQEMDEDEDFLWTMKGLPSVGDGLSPVLAAVDTDE